MDIKDFLIETTECEKKASLEEKKPKSWLKTVSAFANTSGGQIIFGIDDDNNLLGIENVQYTTEKISEIIKERMDPIPEIDLQVITENNKNFIILVVRRGKQTPYYYSGDGNHIAFIRIGNQSVQANATLLQKLVLNGINQSFDSLLSSYNFEDYTFILFKKLYKQRTGHILDKSDFISFGLMNNDSILTNAGALVADYSPIYQSRIFCTRWYGLTKASGLIEALDDAEYSGSIFYILDCGLDFIKRNVKHPWRKGDEYRIEMHEYPERALQESLINAIIHRDYTQFGSEIHIDIFDDRIEIYSPGGMCDGSIVQNLDLNNVPSIRRNPIISDLFGRMNLMERRGTGFKKINESYINALNFRENFEPKFYSTHSTFIVTLYNLNYGRSIEDIAINSTLKSTSNDLLFDLNKDVSFNSKDLNTQKTNVKPRSKNKHLIYGLTIRSRKRLKK